MRDWIDEHGAKYGWRKTEAFSEWWHVNYVGGVSFPTFDTLTKGSRGLRVVRLTKRLAFIQRRGGGAYLPRWYWKYKEPVKVAVRRFQKAYKLKVDGEIGPKTAAKINGVFKRQWRKRGRA
jgi:murein L,D-transpeptidase YcbB/YkuD